MKSHATPCKKGFINMDIVIGLLISIIACKYGDLQFETVFTYVLIALQLHERFIQMINVYKRRNKRYR